MLHLSLPFFLFVENVLCIPKFSPFYTELQCLLWIQQGQRAESWVLYMILPNRLLTWLQNPKTTEHDENRLSFWRYTAFGDSYSYTVSNNKLSLNPCNLNCVHSPRSPNSVHVLQIFHMPTFLCHTVTSHLFEQDAYWLSLPESYTGAIRIIPCLSIPYGWPWELVSDNNHANVTCSSGTAGSTLGTFLHQ